MHIKRFEAATIEAALAQVKAELGPEALILSSRTLRGGRRAFGLLSSERVEVHAALERKTGPESATGTTNDDGRDESARRSPPTPVSQARRLGEDAAAIIAELRQELAERRALDLELREEMRGLRQALARPAARMSSGVSDPVVDSLYRSGLEWVHARALVER